VVADLPQATVGRPEKLRTSYRPRRLSARDMLGAA